MDDEARLSSSEKDPFITNDKIERLPQKTLLYRRVFQKIAYPVPHGLLCVFLLLNVSWTIFNIQGASSSCSEKPTLYEPSDAPVHMKDVQWPLRLGSKSPYTSFDRTVADAAWKNLSIGPNQGWLKQSKEKLKDIGQMASDRVAFADGSGYLLGIDVFHQLHCLNYLRKKTILYSDEYPESAPGEIPAYIHVPHCIDSIRLSLECHADMSLIPQRWADGWLEPWSVWTTKHSCRDFQKIREWAHKQQPYVGFGSLVHPELGPVLSGHLNLSALPVYDEEIAGNTE